MQKGEEEGYEEVMEEIFEILDVDPFLDADDLTYMYQTNYPQLRREDFERIHSLYFNLESIEDFEEKSLIL